MTTPDVKVIWAALSAIAGALIESVDNNMRSSQARLLEAIRDEDRELFIKEIRERFGLGEGWPFDPEGYFRYYAAGEQEIQRAAILECYSSRDRHLVEREIQNAEQAAIATPTRLTEMLNAGYFVVFVPGVIPQSPVHRSEVSTAGFICGYCRERGHITGTCPKWESDNPRAVAKMPPGAKATECPTCGLTYGTHALDCPEAS